MKRQVKSVLLPLRKLRLRPFVLGLSAIIIPIILLISLGQFIVQPSSDLVEEAALLPADNMPAEAPLSAARSPDIAAGTQISVPISASLPDNKPDAGGAAPASIMNSAWQQTIQDEIRQSEYHITWQEDVPLLNETAAYQAPNREHNFRTYFIPEGIRLQPRTETIAGWQWGLNLTGFGYSDNIQPMGTAELTPAANRIAYQRDGITEWYVNGEMGLEQGFTIQRPPAGNNGQANEDYPLVLELAVVGALTPELADDGAAIDFNTANGTRVLRYSDLAALTPTANPCRPTCDYPAALNPAWLRPANCIWSSMTARPTIPSS